MEPEVYGTNKRAPGSATVRRRWTHFSSVYLSLARRAEILRAYNGANFAIAARARARGGGDERDRPARYEESSFTRVICATRVIHRVYNHFSAARLQQARPSL